MTTLWERDEPGPALHALVIGVGRYDYFPGSPTGQHCRRDAFSRELGQLTSPPESARRACRELLDLKGRSDLPLGSLELLLSAGDDGRDDEEFGAVDPARLADVKTAFKRWDERCDSDPGNVALFFFIGHGLQQGRGDQILLLQDTGADPEDYFATAFNFDRMRMGLEANRAQIQCFFVDACRSASDAVDDLDRIEAPPLKQPGKRPVRRDTVIVRSTGAGQSAYGAQYDSTLFTKAVLRALRSPDSRGTQDWAVTTRTIGTAVQYLMEWPGLAVEGRPDQACEVSGTMLGGELFRFDGLPQVPFHFDTDSADSLAAAEWSFHDGSGRLVADRTAKAEPWQDNGPPGLGEVGVTFANGRFESTRRESWLQPPCHAHSVEVRNL
ncbi:caspase family protein [Streptomyces sp. NBC_01233]|uniref:caspase family protein n=1 Tax=Streptomyces sp. NBC_01233 TaxID=2903787 RepID=UPI002E0DBBF1|nr:caspase family protein [Streptomyces sp. NBC_01233]